MAEISDRPIAAQYVATFLKPEMQHIYRQVSGLRAWRPMVICQKRENSGLFPFQDVVVVPKPITHQLRRLWQKQIRGRPIIMYHREARRLAAELQRMKAELLHVYFGHIGVHLLPLLERSEFPVVVSFHGADAQVDLGRPAHRECTQRMLELIDVAAVRSKSIAARLIDLGCDPGKIKLHRTGIPVAQIPVFHRQPPADGAWRCVQACRLIPKKGLLTTLHAFAAFVRNHPHATLTIPGRGPMLEELKSLSAQLGIAERVFFIDFVTPEELFAIYHEAHLFLHPSELAPDGNQEGVPNSMLEAMATGLPVLATRHGGIPEAVEHGVSGMLVAEKDSEGLARAMGELASSPERYLAMSRAARERVEQEFGLAVQITRLEAIYEEARTRFRS
ncbi:MAG: glycosyltransferase [Chthoniobacteraceae bacterium]